jgi:phosphatidylinositol alpha-1,6-mannosyltransferase
VLIVSPDYPPARGGIQTLIGALAERLPVAAVRVVTLDAPGAKAYDGARRVDVRRVRLGTGRRRVRIAALTARAIAEAQWFSPDVALVGHVAAAPAGAALRRGLRIPVVTYVHAEEFRVWPRRSAFAMRHSDRVIAVSRHSARMARDAGADPGRVHLIHHGVDLPPRRNGGRDRGAHPPTVVTVARMQDAHKGHDVMLRAMPMVLERVPDARWVVLGDGPLRAQYERAAADLAIQASVRFCGGVEDAERDRWLTRAHVFAMPTRVPAGGLGGEGFGIAYLEAAAHGLPVVAANEGGALDAVQNGQTGLLVDPRDHTQVAGALVSLLGDPRRAATMGRQAEEWAGRFTWQATAAQVAEVLGLAAWGGGNGGGGAR